MLHKIHSLNLDKHKQNYSGKYMKICDLKFIPQITSVTRDLYNKNQGPNLHKIQTIVLN